MKHRGTHTARRQSAWPSREATISGVRDSLLGMLTWRSCGAAAWSSTSKANSTSNRPYLHARMIAVFPSSSRSLGWGKRTIRSLGAKQAQQTHVVAEGGCAQGWCCTHELAHVHHVAINHSLME